MYTVQRTNTLKQIYLKYTTYFWTLNQISQIYCILYYSKCTLIAFLPNSYEIYTLYVDKNVYFVENIIFQYYFMCCSYLKLTSYYPIFRPGNHAQVDISEKYSTVSPDFQPHVDH